MDHSQHDKSTGRRVLPWALGATGAVIAAPYLLPAVGIGSYSVTGKLLSFCTAGGTEGLAPAISGMLGSTPLIGSALTSVVGGVLASGIIGLGGAMLGRYIEKHYDQNHTIPWGKIIRYASLATSLLIAMPSILSSITIGLGFLAFAVGGYAAATSVAGAAASTLGLAPGISAAGAGASISGLLPHLFTCGVASLPLIGSFFADKAQADSPKTYKAPKLDAPPASWAERVQTPQPQGHAHAM